MPPHKEHAKRLTSPPCHRRRKLVKVAARTRVWQLLASAIVVATLYGVADAPAGAVPPNDPADTMTVLFEAIGSGSALTIDTDPSSERIYDAQLPWQQRVQLRTDTPLLQVVVVGKDDLSPGCRITVEGIVVAEEPVGGSGHCIWVVN
jgi:hypothetical protein